MTGIDSILDSIKADCKNEIEKIDRNKDAVIAKINDKTTKEALEIKKQTEKSIAEDTEKQKEIAKSQSRLIIRNKMLERRREEIDKTMDLALEKVCGFDDEKYFNCIYNAASKLDRKSGTMFLCRKDLERLPSDFIKRLKECGLHADVSDTPVNIKAGFILKDNDIEENADFKVLFNDHKDELEDLINSLLFTQ